MYIYTYLHTYIHYITLSPSTQPCIGMTPRVKSFGEARQCMSVICQWMVCHHCRGHNACFTIVIKVGLSISNLSLSLGEYTMHNCKISTQIALSHFNSPLGKGDSIRKIEKQTETPKEERLFPCSPFVTRHLTVLWGGQNQSTAVPDSVCECCLDPTVYKSASRTKTHLHTLHSGRQRGNSQKHVVPRYPPRHGAPSLPRRNAQRDTYIHIHVHTHIRIHTYMHACICAHTHMHTHTHTHTYIHTYICIRT